MTSPGPKRRSSFDDGVCYKFELDRFSYETCKQVVKSLSSDELGPSGSECSSHFSIVGEAPVEEAIEEALEPVVVPDDAIVAERPPVVNFETPWD